MANLEAVTEKRQEMSAKYLKKQYGVTTIKALNELDMHFDTIIDHAKNATKDADMEIVDGVLVTTVYLDELTEYHEKESKEYDKLKDVFKKVPSASKAKADQEAIEHARDYYLEQKKFK